MSDPSDREWALYERAAAMVEAQVDRQWATTQFFLLLNASVIAGAIALLQVASSAVVGALLVLVLLGGAGLALAGLSVLRVNKRYYRALVAKKTLIEARLGLAASIPGFEASQIATFSLGPLATQAKVARILRDPDAYVNPRVRRWSATDWARGMLLGLLLFDVLAAALVLHALWGCPIAAGLCR